MGQCKRLSVVSRRLSVLSRRRMLRHPIDVAGQSLLLQIFNPSILDYKKGRFGNDNGSNNFC